MPPSLRDIVATLPDTQQSFVRLTRLVPLAVAAAYLQMTCSALRGAVNRGSIRAHKIDGRLHIGDSEIERFHAARRHVQPPAARRRRPAALNSRQTAA